MLSVVLMSVYICAAKRSPIASFQGSLQGFSAPQLGAYAIASCLSEAKIDPSHIEEVFMGSVLTAGQGQAPARQAALAAKLPQETPCTTIGKVCGSGLKSVMLGELSIRAGQVDCLIAGGMESMTNAPYLIEKARQGLRMGNQKIIDSMLHDGLWDAYHDQHMGQAAEMCAKKYDLNRVTQDEFALESYRRAHEAQKAGRFDDEIFPIEIKKRKETLSFSEDEEVGKLRADKVPGLRPVFDQEGTITAANSSSLSDGAAAVLLCSEKFVKTHQLKPLAKVSAQGQAAGAPEWFSTAPARSIEKLLKSQNLKVADIDLWEINEAFSAVALANQKILDIDSQRLNIHGGAVALGHPIGASGTRILATLCHALKNTSKKYGVASLCIGGGEATSLLVENVS